MHPVPSLSRRPQHPTTACRRSSDPGAPDTGSRDQHRRCIAMCHILRHFASARRSRSSEGRPDQAIAHAQGAAVRSREFGRVGVDWGLCASRSPPGADLICWLPQRISRAPTSALLKPPRRAQARLGGEELLARVSGWRSVTCFRSTRHARGSVRKASAISQSGSVRAPRWETAATACTQERQTNHSILMAPTPDATVVRT